MNGIEFQTDRSARKYSRSDDRQRRLLLNPQLNFLDEIVRRTNWRMGHVVCLKVYHAN